uniref:Alpha-carbonic anhydrase domain-containing protein n=1 Tax=Elaeophora elaphi TaxID=1147741 RepID=A0A0R3RG06_9BILA
MLVEDIKNCHSIENLCSTGKQQSPILIDANRIKRQNETEKIFKLIGFNSEESIHFRILNFLPTELSITNFNHGPWLQYDRKTFALYKIRFVFKYGLKGGLHRLINFGEIERAVGEILMEFEMCHKNVKKKQYFFISSILVLTNQVQRKMSNNNNNKMIDFDEIFYGYPISKNPADKKPPSKGIQLPIRLRHFMPHSFNGAISYVGSFFEGDCLEGVTYLIFDTPIIMKPGLQLTRFYSNSINSTRPIQDDRPALYYMSSNIEFLEGEHEDNKFCPKAKIQINDTTSANANLDGSQDFQDLFDQKNLGETLLPKLPIIVGAGKARLISPHLLLFIFDIVLIFFNP